MQAELQQVSAARQEADRKRKQAEQQIQEVSLRLADLDRTRGDLGDKAAKCQVPCFLLNTSYLVSRDALNTKLILRLSTLYLHCKRTRHFQLCVTLFH